MTADLLEGPFPDGPSSQDKLRAIRLVLAVVLATVVLLWLVDRVVAGCNWHLAMQFGGSSEAILGAVEPRCRGLAKADVLWSLALDSVLAAAYGLGGFAILKMLARAWSHPVPSGISNAVPWFPIYAMGLDALENVLSILWLESHAVNQQGFEWLPLSLLTIAWTKWALIASSVMFIFLSALAFFVGNRASRPPNGPGMPTYDPTTAARHHSANPGLAVCLSGGGIRSAGFSLGVLAGLEDTGLVSEIERISAVSGGAYAATSWRLWKQNQRDPATPVAQKIIDALVEQAPTEVKEVAGSIEESESTQTSPGDSPDPSRLRTRWGKHRYLWNTGSGPVGTVLWGALCVAFGIVVLAAATLIVGWPLGRLIGSWIVLGSDDISRSGPGTFTLTPRHWFPPMVFLVISLVSFAVSMSYRKTLNVGVAAFGVSAALFVLLIALPWGLLRFGYLLVDGGAIRALVLVGVGLASGAVGFVGRMFVGYLGKLLPKLGGVLLALVLLIFVFTVAAQAAFQGPINAAVLETWPIWSRALIALEVFLIVYLVVDMEWVTLRRLYRNRLDYAFSPEGFPSQVTWSELATRPELPELLICAAVNHSGFARIGSPSRSFTVSPSVVTQGLNEVAWAKYASTLTTDLKKVVAWMPITGAAFASAMGIRGVGTTGALMAALNVDLGAWLPNVSKVIFGFTEFPPPRLGYLIKEIFGLYSDETDDRVFVADGGHWENLGLVELLRRRHQRIICVDASGDQPRTHTTLREAVVLAQSELGDDFDIDLTPLEQNQEDAHGDAKSSVVGLPFVMRSTDSTPVRGWIWYAKLQLADDQPKEVKKFTRADRKFPNYSTMNQLLDDQQFAYLTLAGKSTGSAIAALDEAARYDVSPWHIATAPELSDTSDRRTD